MKNIILLTPLQGNGGIASWSRKFIDTFASGGYSVIPVDRAVKGRQFEETSFLKRFSAGRKELRSILAELNSVISGRKVDILHTTTSGSMGTYRDYKVAQLCNKRGIAKIIHLHYGCATEDLRRPLFGRFLLKTMAMYDQIWVLDSRTYNTFAQYPELKDKVYITPNSIAVNEDVDIAPKSYRHIAFVANLVPTKGLFELVEAFKQVNDKGMTLSIVGKGSPIVLEKLKEATGGCDNIHILGQLPNREAVEFMRTVDIVALPTYYPWEAFPISILEAMSLGKLVVSTRRAAIGDMLTGLDGKPCGIFVRERSVSDIAEAIRRCVENPKEADALCRSAYQKVYSCYRMEVVYRLYESLYGKLYDKG